MKFKVCTNCFKQYIPWSFKLSKFCSKTCSAIFNNKQIGRRHGNPKSKCLLCKKENSSHKRKYCSRVCAGMASRKNLSIEFRRAKNAQAQSKYRQKKLRKIHPTANTQLILEFYINRPKGYEVDHKIPLTKGGLHHQDNLQYLPKLINRKKSNKLNFLTNYDTGL